MPETTTFTGTEERAERRRETNRGLKVERLFTEGTEVEDVFDLAGGPWAERDARILGADGEPVFEQVGVEAPEGWSQMAVNVVASKYLRGRLGFPEREHSVRQLVARVAGSISTWAFEDGYLADPGEREAFRAELTFLLVSQRAAFNSPVWFNVGVEERPQCSACFINSVEDTMESIMDLAKTEGMIFKYGSGAGINLSRIRGKDEHLSCGGTASGPISFMKGYDAFAGAIKSGGKTRRAAKIVSLDADHPDVFDFVRSKIMEERKAEALLDAGFTGGMDGDAYSSVFFQNANHSVRVTDAFMRAALHGGTWDLRARKSGEVTQTVSAEALLDLVAETAHDCGDPGLQFDDAANAWHTCPEDGRINASNPCSEFMFLDDSACNLASLNLRKFQRADGDLEVEEFVHAAGVMTLAQEVLVDRARYPTPAIERNSRRFRPLGLGYANLGAFLMARGLPYDSEAGRAYAAALTALMTASAYYKSASVARAKGPFEGYADNSGAMLHVVRRHAAALGDVDVAFVPVELLECARAAFNGALLHGDRYGFRNAQVTLLAPTGTIAFMMDCDTTGIEPDISLLKRKLLVGGGEMTYENRSVDRALQRLGYDGDEVRSAVLHLRRTGSLAGSAVRSEHLPVFDCALPDAAGRVIPWEGHVRMVGAVQPFLSGAVSKTVNLPEGATVADVRAAYVLSWELGLKAVAVYRDNSKRIQPLKRGSNGKNGNGKKKGGTWVSPPAVQATGRERLPETRGSVTHKIDIGGHEGYVTAGMYPDGRLGELFVVMAKSGSTVSGLLDAWATVTSIAIQYGVPYDVLREKFLRTRFEPAGFTHRGMATSVLDYIFNWLEEEFPGGRRRGEVPEFVPLERTPIKVTSMEELSHRVFDSGPPCATCGSIMEPNGTCHRCPTCGTTNGCG